MLSFLLPLAWTNVLILIFAAFLTSSCRVFKPSLMLRTPPNFKYDTVPSTYELYKVAPNDILSVKFAPNKGYKMLEPASGGAQTLGATQLTLKVDYDGTVNMPVAGRIYVAGLTIRELENKFQEILSEYFNDPYVEVSVTNRIILIFPGGEGTARVLPLSRDNMTLLEAIATAGGIPQYGKAYKVKVIRGGLKNPKVYIFDLSTLESAKNADFILQANDIIYIERVYNIPMEIVSQITPYLTLISTILSVIALYRVFAK